MAKQGVLERLSNGGTIVCAEGYLLELERRGYLKSGAFIPEVVLDKPEVVKQLHEEFVHAGSDVVEAFTYYGHREKLRSIGREADLEPLNRCALRMARSVADSTGTLMAGNICNTSLYDNGDEEHNKEQVQAMFKEQVEWAVEEGADFIVGETFKALGEANLALEATKQYGKGLPAVITFAVYAYDVTSDGVPIPAACRQLEDNGAAVVGLNCARGPGTMMPLIKEIRKACKGPIAALPVPYQTTDKEQSWMALRDRETGKYVYPLDIQCFQSKRSEIREFAEEAKKAGVQYIGLCCGNASIYTRELAEVYGRTPGASTFSPRMQLSTHFSESAQEDESRKRIRKHMRGDEAL